MNFKIILGILFFAFSFSIYGQKTTKNILKPYKVGVLYNYGTEENFIFDDADYTYTSNILKGQAFYKLGNWKNFDFELIVQPQIQVIKHQLLNEQYVLPSEEDYQAKRTEFTKRKTIHLYALEFGFSAQTKIVEQLNLQGTVSLGFSSIDKRSERLAKGFTFIENFSVGFSYQAAKKTYLYLGTNFGHVSNLNFQKPNDGYNILGLEIGLSYVIK